jgi:hypothetical protein
MLQITSGSKLLALILQATLSEGHTGLLISSCKPKTRTATENRVVKRWSRMEVQIRPARGATWIMPSAPMCVIQNSVFVCIWALKCKLHGVLHVHRKNNVFVVNLNHTVMVASHRYKQSSRPGAAASECVFVG